MLETLDLLFTKAVDLQKMRVEVPRLTSLCRTKKRKEKISLTFFKTSLHKNLKFSIKDFLRKCDQIRSILQIWSHLLKQPIDKCSFSMHFQLVSADWHSAGFFFFCIFSFRKKENFYVSAAERLKQRGKYETKSNVYKHLKTYLLCMKKRCEFCY